MSDDYKPQTGPSKPLNKAPRSPSDIVDTYRPDSEEHISNVLKKAMKDPDQATYTKGKS